MATLDRRAVEAIDRYVQELLAYDELLYDFPDAPPGPSMEEVQRHIREIEGGTEIGIPLDEHLARMKAKFGL